MSVTISRLEPDCNLFSVRQCQSWSTRSDFDKSRLQAGCILSRCCQSCSYSNFTWAAAKERLKSRSVLEKNKACQRCILCKSMSFCLHCSKCPQGCQTSVSGEGLKILASLAGLGCVSQSAVHLERRIFSALQRQTTTQQVSFDCKQGGKPAQKQVSNRSLDLIYTKTSCRKSGSQVFPSLFTTVSF